MPIIEFLIVAACILYFLRMLFRLVLPMLLQGLVNKVQNQNTGNQQFRESKRTDSKVKVDYIPNGSKKSAIPDSEGDFIDYEEIK
jgi:hypothetical protein